MELLIVWKKALSSHAQKTTKMHYLSKKRFGRLQVTFREAADANNVWCRRVEHICADGKTKLILNWQHPEKALHIKERAQNPDAVEVLMKEVPAEISPDMIYKLLVTTPLEKSGRPSYQTGAAFHRVVDPMTGADMHKIKGLVKVHTGDKHRWWHMLYDTVHHKQLLVRFPSLECEFCNGMHFTKLHDDYIWNVDSSFPSLVSSCFASAKCDDEEDSTGSGGVPGLHGWQQGGLALHRDPERGGCYTCKQGGGEPDGDSQGVHAVTAVSASVFGPRVWWCGPACTHMDFWLIAAYLPAQAGTRSSFLTICLTPFVWEQPVSAHLVLMGDLNLVEDPELDRSSRAGSRTEDLRLRNFWPMHDMRDAFRAGVQPEEEVEWGAFALGPRFLEADAAELGRSWTEAEVKEAIASQPKGKSPGHDGLPAEFFAVHWDLLGGRVMQMVKDFERTGRVLECLATAVTVLLHTKGEKDQLGNYRPIALLNAQYIMCILYNSKSQQSKSQKQSSCLKNH
ncbi:unnamed protein product [Closterium sp. NIES-54]